MSENVIKFAGYAPITAEMIADAEPIRAALDQAYEDLRLFFAIGPVYGPPKPRGRRRIVVRYKGRDDL